MNNMNVIIADDHPIVLFGIRKSLEQIEWVNVVGEFEDSTALINNLPKLDAHVLITDLSMPGDKYGDGITLIKYIKRHFPDLSIIVLTMNNNPAILSAVLDLDIEGIVLKQGAPTDLPKALAALQKGKKFTGSISLIPGPVYPRLLISASGKTGYIPAQLCFTGSRKNGGNQTRLRESPRILSVTSEDT